MMMTIAWIVFGFAVALVVSCFVFAIVESHKARQEAAALALKFKRNNSSCGLQVFKSGTGFVPANGFFYH
jgi:hypothetical protein